MKTIFYPETDGASDIIGYTDKRHRVYDIRVGTHIEVDDDTIADLKATFPFLEIEGAPKKETKQTPTQKSAEPIGLPEAEPIDESNAVIAPIIDDISEISWAELLKRAKEQKVWQSTFKRPQLEAALRAALNIK